MESLSLFSQCVRVCILDVFVGQNCGIRTVLHSISMRFLMNSFTWTCCDIVCVRFYCIIYGFITIFSMWMPYKNRNDFGFVFRWHERIKTNKKTTWIYLDFSLTKAHRIDVTNTSSVLARTRSANKMSVLKATWRVFDSRGTLWLAQPQNKRKSYLLHRQLFSWTRFIDFHAVISSLANIIWS